MTIDFAALLNGTDGTPAETPAQTEVVTDPAEAVETDEPTVETDETEDTDTSEDADAETEGDEPEDEADEDDEPETTEVVEVSPEAKYLIDGEELTGAELKANLLRQADYSRKTQQLAAERKQFEAQMSDMREWVEERVADPVEWVKEIATQFTENPSLLITHVLVDLASQGLLHEDLVEAFGLNHDQIGTLAKANERDRLVARDAKKRERDGEREREQEQRSALDNKVASLEKQLGELVAEHSLTDEQALEVLQVAIDSNSEDLSLVFDGITARRARAERQAAQTKDARAKALVEKKRKASALATSGSAKASAAPVGDSIEEIAAAAWAEIAARKK